ncbi:Dps family protein [Clostridium isatidis]|uniref:DNA starvation/stationary phase protection protein n=1 Tax=Clostridium isatidis TaxID=182773 RepID=A0A343J8Y4_9CLOT|nr:DNA starvation/stationary phase protection protein [Clostridium isatidis]ASW41992.1 DNA starvation/stationary phase protection protein [Clostridium isatidis]NLZ33991.1 DNA starvation/stationary phase protection protein [Clostridiales bacterium]
MKKELNQYLANLAVLNVKLHNLHWNVVGEQFKAIHEFTEGLYDAYFKLYDEIAELLKIRGEYPAASLKTYLEIATVKELAENVDFSTKEVLDIIIADMQLMKNLALNIRTLADEAGDFEIIAEMEDHIKDYNKNLWMLSAMTK